MARQGGCFGGHALHEVAIAYQRVGEMVDDAEARPVVTGGEVRFGHGQPHAVAETLAQRTGGGFHAGRQAALRMPGRAAAPLAELLELVQRQFVARQMQQA